MRNCNYFYVEAWLEKSNCEVTKIEYFVTRKEKLAQMDQVFRFDDDCRTVTFRDLDARILPKC